MNQKTVNILIIGGGFAGVECARLLCRNSDFSVTLVSRQDHMEYYPAVFRSFGTRDARFSKLPLHDLLPFKNCTVVIDTVTGIDVATKSATLQSGQTLSGDRLVLCPGMEVSYFNIPGADTSTLSFRSTDDSIAIANHIHMLFETNKQASIDEQLAAFRFIIVGAGPAGCEIAAGISLFAHKLAVKYGVSGNLISVDLIEGRDRVLPTLDPRVSSAVQHRLHHVGVHTMLFRRLTEGHMWSAKLSDATLGSRTIIWSAGIAVPKFVSGLADVQYNPKGRFVVNEYCELAGHPGVYAIGDIADTPKSGLAQTAIHDGAFVANDIRCTSRTCARATYREPQVGVIVPLGRGYGVVQIGGMVLTGWIGWIARGVADLDYYYARLPWPQVWQRLTRLF